MKIGIIGNVTETKSLVALARINILEKQGFNVVKLDDKTHSDNGIKLSHIVFDEAINKTQYHWHCKFTFKGDKLECYLTETNNCKTFKELRRLWRDEKPNLKLISAVRK